jgi:MFS family permease
VWGVVCDPRRYKEKANASFFFDTFAVMDTVSRDRLFTPSFLFACVGNFLLFFGFYLLLPVLPVYLMDAFRTSAAKTGLILSCYVVAALAVRPFTGFVADRFSRKGVYILFYGFFVAVFVAYPVVNVLWLFVLCRVLHGLAFGMVTTTGNTLVVDIMPSSRRGEGLGYFGIANNLAMAAGPMMGLVLLNGGHAYNALFYTALGSGVLGFLFASRIKAPQKIRTVSEPLSLDRFFLRKGLPAGLSLLLMAIPYGITTSYLAMYARVIQVHGTTGLFFSLMAAGLIVSRTFSGKLIDRGKLVRVVVAGQSILVVAFALFGGLGWMMDANWVSFLFFTVAVLLGVGYGMIFPAYNTLFVDLASNNRRVTASSTYLTSWDIGIGCGLVFGGMLSDAVGFPATYLVGTVSVLISTLFFYFKAGPHFERYKLR